MLTLRADHGTDRRTRSFYQAARADDVGDSARSRSFYQGGGRGPPDSLRPAEGGAYDDGFGGRAKSRSFYERLADANEIATAPGKVSLAPTRPKSPCDPGGNVDDKRNLSTLGLLLIAFFWVGGGIYGPVPWPLPRLPHVHPRLPVCWRLAVGAHGRALLSHQPTNVLRRPAADCCTGAARVAPSLCLELCVSLPVCLSVCPSQPESLYVALLSFSPSLSLSHPTIHPSTHLPNLGNEPLLESGPPAFALSLLIGAALFYALPLAMISAELGTALPYDGGMVAWVNETCGRSVGLHNMYWLWVSFLFDSAAYPVLAASYASQKWVTPH